MSVLKISNRDARHLWLAGNGLSQAPIGTLDAIADIHALGFVQLDTIQVVSRAHHHILWSRNQAYREPMMDDLLGQGHGVFEHFTHDASVLPMSTLPLWQRQFRRMKEKVARSSWYGDALDARLLDEVMRRIADEGPLSTRDFDTKIAGTKEIWKRPPHKKALDYLWYSGDLATSHRTGFTKFYDLAENVFPADLRTQKLDDLEQIDGLCAMALDRIGMGSLTEIRKFWDATEVKEVSHWAKRQGGDLVPVEVQAFDGSWSKSFTRADIEQRLDALEPPAPRLRILSPFDPAIRDRTRLKRLFGFDYTVEMFVPAAKRIWGYYVYPVLEGDRFVGRIEAKGDRKNGVLNVLNYWMEPDVNSTKARIKKLDAELGRFAKLAGLTKVNWICPR
ncbi:MULTISPECIES: winged helix-turn-helix domain-containing protein [Pacificibacter]|uniref:winged helix-turn-helix domain-containing protein n=1 Tax=Pacificibacter TaxID=1042323 RepID=UPI001C093109|nr:MULTISPECIES: crosslink repair DNA glycosylase YcaQ family protein [Pacificibacter]MBU2934577.1 winged helix DNA-binding domain-containing protein [Pacificibacter marinus]MDO6616979.1 crosslink repair DNA glycosylase YcaQ family protein [Pacificibacter sp. 1_MG-2023]